VKGALDGMERARHDREFQDRLNRRRPVDQRPAFAAKQETEGNVKDTWRWITVRENRPVNYRWIDSRLEAVEAS
jgi:hypothetical protein